MTASEVLQAAKIAGATTIILSQWFVVDDSSGHAIFLSRASWTAATAEERLTDLADEHPQARIVPAEAYFAISDRAGRAALRRAWKAREAEVRKHLQ